jgi:hypothetical protein
MLDLMNIEETLGGKIDVIINRFASSNMFPAKITMWVMGKAFFRTGT